MADSDNEVPSDTYKDSLPMPVRVERKSFTETIELPKKRVSDKEKKLNPRETTVPTSW